MSILHPVASGGAGGTDRAASCRPVLHVPQTLLTETFTLLRRCGDGRAECQVLWIGPWADPTVVTAVVHPVHRAHFGGFVLDDAWLTEFWFAMGRRGDGVRAQIHTHPWEAFHSATDDAFPMVHLEGFLSLVIPDFAQGPVGLDRSYLAEIGADGAFHEVDPFERLRITPDGERRAAAPDIPPNTKGYADGCAAT